jgi:hypothetical protein
MKLENQVTSLELSKKLKELGFPQDSLFYWFNPYFRKCSDSEYKLEQGQGSQKDISSYTVAELGELLPSTIHINGMGNVPMWTGRNGYGEWLIEYHITFNPPVVEIIEKTEADCRAKMLIWLTGNGYIKPSSEEKNE